MAILLRNLSDELRMRIRAEAERLGVSQNTLLLRVLTAAFPDETEKAMVDRDRELREDSTAPIPPPIVYPVEDLIEQSVYNPGGGRPVGTSTAVVIDRVGKHVRTTKCTHGVPPSARCVLCGR